MKNLLFTLIIGMLASAIYAGNHKTPVKAGYGIRTEIKDTGKNKMMHPECYVMKDGKMMHKKNGKMTAMTKDVTLTDGSVVMMDGTVVRKDGTRITLKEGEKIEMNGTIKPAKSGKM
jgi:hypothetical protein